MWKASKDLQGIVTSSTVLEDTGDSALYMYGTVMDSVCTSRPWAACIRVAQCTNFPDS